MGDRACADRSSSSSSFSRWTEPAAACRRFSIWHYNFPQPPCPIQPGGPSRARAGRAGYSFARLTEIIWGETGDGRLVAIGKLRVLSSRR